MTDYTPSRQEAEQFDRWLESVKEEAWHKGFNAGVITGKEKITKKLTCAERDELIGDADEWGVGAGLTDMDGDFGVPIIDTTWERGVERVRDIRHWGREDEHPCEHFYWKESQTYP
jgi:hypothetical protein